MKNPNEFLNIVLQEIAPILCKYYAVKTKDDVKFCEQIFGLWLNEFIEYYLYINSSKKGENFVESIDDVSIFLDSRQGNPNEIKLTDNLINLIKLSQKFELDFPISINSSINSKDISEKKIDSFKEISDKN